MFLKNLFSSHFSYILCFVVFVYSLGFAISVNANEIYSAELCMDGSALPPGDRIDIKVIVYPEVKDASIEVLAYLVSGEHNEVQTMIKARGDTKNKDTEGYFRLSVPLLKAGKESIPSEAINFDEKAYLRTLTRSLIIPYAELNVPTGNHQIVYEVRMLVNDNLVDKMPTPLSILVVTEKVRKEMIYKVSKYVYEQRVRKDDGYIWKNDNLAPVKYERMYTVAKPVWETRTSEVNIEGEFIRKQLVGTAKTAIASLSFVPEPRRIIYFATNREIVKPNGTVDDYFGNESVLATDKMTYGSCSVSIPINNHRPGDIEQQGSKWWFWTEDPDPEKHFLVQDFNGSIGIDKFKHSIGKNDVLIYVHGYGNTFKDAILRSAQLNHDLEFGGKVVAFSWPSAGNLLLSISDHYNANINKVEIAYNHDEEVATHSHAFLATLIEQLLNQQENGNSNGKIHIIAHSMGNRILLKALHELNSTGKLKKNGPKLGHIFLAAADIDGVTYANVRSTLIDNCERVTYYFASDDKALLLSRIKHQDKPIGLSPVFDKDKIDTISADNLTSVFYHLGHSYVSESKSMLTDIRLIINRDLSPIDRRPPLGPRIEAPDLTGCFYWTFVHER
jgi:esterase/lipase superfamily enzyme